MMSFPSLNPNLPRFLPPNIQKFPNPDQPSIKTYTTIQTTDVLNNNFHRNSIIESLGEQKCFGLVPKRKQYKCQANLKRKGVQILLLYKLCHCMPPISFQKARTQNTKLVRQILTGRLDTKGGDDHSGILAPNYFEPETDLQILGSKTISSPETYGMPVVICFVTSEEMFSQISFLEYLK